MRQNILSLQTHVKFLIRATPQLSGERHSPLRVLDLDLRRFNFVAPSAARPVVRRRIEVGSGIGPNTYVVRANSKNGRPCESKKTLNSILATPLPVN